MRYACSNITGTLPYITLALYVRHSRKICDLYKMEVRE